MNHLLVGSTWGSEVVVIDQEPGRKNIIYGYTEEYGHCTCHEIQIESSIQVIILTMTLALVSL